MWNINNNEIITITITYYVSVNKQRQMKVRDVTNITRFRARNHDKTYHYIVRQGWGIHSSFERGINKENVVREIRTLLCEGKKINQPYYLIELPSHIYVYTST